MSGNAITHSHIYIHILQLLSFAFIFLQVSSSPLSEEEINQHLDSNAITCGSIIRLQNIMTQFYLASYPMQWATGSKRQIVTSVKESDSYDSLFIIKEAHNHEPCPTGTQISCNDTIRLEHVKTGKNLHSHLFPSYITDSQEVCGFGDNGYGDESDNWKIVCYKYNEPILKGNAHFLLQHTTTGQFLYINIKKSMFNEYNCRGCPILNHREVSCTTNKDKQALWKVSGGIIWNANAQDNIDYTEEKRRSHGSDDL